MSHPYFEKVTISKQYGGPKPKFDVNLLFQELGFVLDEEQYQDAILTMDLFHASLKRQQVNICHSMSPVHSNIHRH